MQVGKLAKHYIRPFLAYCETVDHDEFDRLLDPKYSKQTFDINYAFAKPADSFDAEQHKRYWTDLYIVRGVRVRVTSQWFEYNRIPFAAYLMAKGIATEAEIEQFAQVSAADVQAAPPVASRTRRRSSPVPSSSSRANARYRGWPIGNAQNLMVRNILSSVGTEAFSERDWRETQEYFGHRCAYCGAEAKLIMEHAIPINRDALGEHRLGNIVPSCDACNKTKADKGFRAFLEGNPEAVVRIEAYMDSRNYVPLGDNEQMRMILDMAHGEVAVLADRYIAIINSLFASDSGETPVADVEAGEDG